MEVPETSELRLRIETFAATKGSTWFTSAECQRYAECTHHAAKVHLTELVKAGKLESSSRKGYRMPTLVGKDAPEAPPGAAPGPSLPEQTAATKAAPPLPAPSTEEPPAAGPPPFAGVVEELGRLRGAVPVTITVDFDIDEIAERVMARIAAKMVGK